MTCLAEEQAEQRRWQFLRPDDPLPLYDQLVEREFVERERQDRYCNAMLAKVVQHAVAECPFHAEQFARLGLKPADVATIQDLPKLPVLTRRTLLDREADLVAKRLPPGEKRYGVSSSSGSTGRATSVHTTVRSNWMFTHLSQRALRWMRCDPMATYAMIRPASRFPLLGGHDRYEQDGNVTRLPRWPYVGTVFHTGPAIAIPIHHSVEQKLAWLAEHRASYLTTYSGILEELAFAAGGMQPKLGFRHLVSIASQLTEPMRQRIEQTFGVPVSQSYGLNEVGLVAFECEAHRFHVNTEHCIVEIVDTQGQPCRAGERGLIAITAIQNFAMPLFRYDTDDTARWSEGPCPCGRTSPTFEAISGRMRRYATLPEGTRPRINLLTETLETAPTEWLVNLRRYQIHQRRDDSYELRFVASSPLPTELIARLLEGWGRLPGAAATPLSIAHVDDIPLGPGGKRLDFVSDYWSEMDAAATNPAQDDANESREAAP